MKNWLVRQKNFPQRQNEKIHGGPSAIRHRGFTVWNKEELVGMVRVVSDKVNGRFCSGFNDFAGIQEKRPLKLSSPFVRRSCRAGTGLQEPLLKTMNFIGNAVFPCRILKM